jgi:hypothetical protein
MRPRPVTKARVDMSLVLEQSFPLGRFHATRWNQNPFEDPYGEWPPSPWRLLRALTARWFQYIRETEDAAGLTEEELRARLATDLPLPKLARELPGFVLPDATWRGTAIRQYHPLGLEEQYKYRKVPGGGNVLDYSFKQVGTTLVQDHYRAVSPNHSILWVWEATELSPAESSLLGQLLRRVLYFGRAESRCQFRIVDGEGITPNCHLSTAAGAGNPVLAAVPGTDLNFESLLAITDSSPLKSRRIPAGTAWYYASIPPRPAYRPVRPPRRRHPDNLCVLQFAVGGRVYPPPAHWVKLTERFRDRVIRERCRQITGQPDTRYTDLNPSQRDQLRLIRGLDGDGGRVDGRATAFFALLPDAEELPTRLVCWRQTPFTDEEIDAFLAATEYPLRWEYGSDDWQVRLIPLPFSVPQPPEYWGRGRVWESVTPFVLPTGRRRVRGNSWLRPGETPEACLRKLVVRFGLPEPQVELLTLERIWVTIHETPDERVRRDMERGTRLRPGYHVRLTFSDPVAGPLCAGHSCHFGLGVFSQVG